MPSHDPQLELPSISFHHVPETWHIYVDGHYCRPLDCVLVGETPCRVVDLVALLIRRPETPSIVRHRAELWQVANIPANEIPRGA